MKWDFSVSQKYSLIHPIHPFFLGFLHQFVCETGCLCPFSMKWMPWASRCHSGIWVCPATRTLQPHLATGMCQAQCPLGFWMLVLGMVASLLTPLVSWRFELFPDAGRESIHAEQGRGLLFFFWLLWSLSTSIKLQGIESLWKFAVRFLKWKVTRSAALNLQKSDIVWFNQVSYLFNRYKSDRRAQWKI